MIVHLIKKFKLLLKITASLLRNFRCTFSSYIIYRFCVNEKINIVFFIDLSSPETILYS